MPQFSDSSLAQLKTCHNDLNIIFSEVIKVFDCTIVCGYRGKEAQNKAFEEGASKVKFPNGNHNAWPSNALDAYPYPIDYKDLQRICYFSGFVMGTAKELFLNSKISHKIRWGADWNSNTKINDENFKDFGHFELVV